MLSLLLFGFFCCCRGFCHRTRSIFFSFFSYKRVKIRNQTRNEFKLNLNNFVRFAGCCTSLLDFHSKLFQTTSNYWHRATDTQRKMYHKLRKTFGKYFRSFSEHLSKFSEMLFQEYISEGIPHPVFCGDQVYKPRRITTNFVRRTRK